MILSPFRASAAAPNRRPEATEQFRRDLDRIIAEARHWRVDARTLADLLEGHAENLRMQFAVTAGIG